MNLLTPIAGFLIGYGGIMGYQVIDSTYKGEMPGPKSFGYFIGGMTLLSAATIYALGRTDKVFNAGGLSQFTPEELTQSSAIHGDFDHASLNYSGHQNMILRAESDSCQNCESPSTQTTLIVNKYGDEHEYKFCGDGCEGQYMRENKMSYDAEGNYNDFIEDMEGVMGKYGEMKDFDSGYNPQNNLLKARMVVEVDDEDFGDVDFDAENYDDDMEVTFKIQDADMATFYYTTDAPSGLSNEEIVTYVWDNRYEIIDDDWFYLPYDWDGVGEHYYAKIISKTSKAESYNAEMMMPEKQCVICGGPYTGYGHNPEPIFPMSRGRCCDVCNATVVIPYRLGGMNFRFGEDFEAQGRDVMGRFVKMDCDLCGGKDEVGYVDGEREFKVCEHCDIDGDDYNPKLWEAETVRKFRNRFDKTSPRGNRRSRAATGVKRNIWKNFFRKDAEDMSDELDMVMAQLYEIEDMKNPTPEDLTNYQNLLTRYYEVVRFNAEQKTARVRTMSGKPVSETLRKLKQDKNLSAKDARTRKEIKAENMEVKKSGKSQRWIAGAEGINKKGINWIDTEESDYDWNEEEAAIDALLSSKGYSKMGGGQFDTNRKYAWVIYRFRRYLQDLAEKIKGYRGVVEDREYLKYMHSTQFVFSPWKNTAKNKVALVWQFYDDEGLVSEPYYKYFSLTTPPEWYDTKFELHIGEDYRYDSCPICDYKNSMKSISDARKLAAHIYSHGPMMNATPFNDFSIEVPQPSWSDEESLEVDWGNPMAPKIEIIESQLPYLYGFDFAEYWSPTKSQQARYRKKANAIKAGLRAAGFKPKR